MKIRDQDNAFVMPNKIRTNKIPEVTLQVYLFYIFFDKLLKKLDSQPGA